MPAVAVPIFTLSIPLPFTDQPYAFLFTPAQLYAAAAIAVMSYVNYLGVKLGGVIQVTPTIIKVAAVLAVVAVGFALGGGAAASAAVAGSSAPEPRSPRGAVRAVSLRRIPCRAGGGALGLRRVDRLDDGRGSGDGGAAEKHPAVARAGSGGGHGAHILMNAVCFYVLPFAKVALSSTVASDVLALVAGQRTAAWLTVAMIICALGTLNSSTLSGARVGYAMARDGIFFKVAAGINPRFHTPGGALAFQAAAACLLALTGTFEDLYSLVVFAQWIFYGLATASVFGLRRREPDLPRPYRTWGYPVVLGAVRPGRDRAHREPVGRTPAAKHRRPAADPGWARVLNRRWTGDRTAEVADKKQPGSRA